MGKFLFFSPAALTSFFPADLRIRPMIHVVKKWARYNQINDASKGTLSSYTLVLMVLHYLQSQYKHTQPRSVFFPCAVLTYCQSHLVLVVFSTALKEPVLPSLQRDYPVSPHIVLLEWNLGSFFRQTWLHHRQIKSVIYWGTRSFSFCPVPSFSGVL